MYTRTWGSESRGGAVTLKLTVLGSCGGYARPGRACSGYLFELGDSDLVLDIGAGALSNMLKYVEADALDYLVITHLHYDHYVDVYGLLTARRFWERALPPLPVLAPAGTRQVVGEALSPESREEFLSCMEFIDAEDRVPVRFAGFEILPYEAAHSVPAFGYRITAGGRTVCYTGDTDRSELLVDMAGGADLFICEATFTSEVKEKIPGHLTASEAGSIAAEARVGRLLLTHVWPTLDEGRAVEDAESVFGGPVDVAVDGLTLEI
jgi:ribonuclease BN (tRNA processing enzyme)